LRGVGVAGAESRLRIAPASDRRGICSCAMWDSSDSDDEPFVPAVLNRPKVANYMTHESFTCDTRDHEDHTFCGMMFNIRCLGPKESSTAVPVDFLQVDAISVRGDLGPLTVWSTPGSFSGKEHAQDEWELLYEREHSPSRRDYAKLDLVTPVRLLPGESCGIYVHSKLRGDDAIVYDNQRSQVTYEDNVFRVYPGLAHLSNRPFGRHGMWGFPWRERREFVGRCFYGVGYKLWNPEVHSIFPSDFRQVVRLFLMTANRQDSPLHRLQDEVLFYILNMCRYDWFRVAPQLARSQQQQQPQTLEEMYNLAPLQWGPRIFPQPSWASLVGHLAAPVRSSASDEDESESDSEISGASSSDARSMSDVGSSRRKMSEEAALIGDENDDEDEEVDDDQDADLEHAFREVARTSLPCRDGASGCPATGSRIAWAPSS